MVQKNSLLRVDVRDGVTVVAFADRKMLDEVGISEMGQQLNAIVADKRSPKVLLDFNGVSHMSSSALGMIITLNKRIRERDGELRLANIEPRIYEVFVITRLNEIFHIHTSLQEAIDGMGGPAA